MAAMKLTPRKTTPSTVQAFEVWDNTQPEPVHVGSYVELLLPGRPDDQRVWIADVHDFDRSEDFYDPIRLGVYEDPAQMHREMLDYYTNAIFEPTTTP